MAQTAEIDLPAEGTITEGDTYPLSIDLDDSDGSEIDISGWKFWLTVKEGRFDDDSEAIVQKSTTSHVDAANGETELVLDSSDTEGLNGGKFYDVQVKKSNGDIQTLFKGTMSFGPGATDTTS